MKEYNLSEKDVNILNTNRGLRFLLSRKDYNPEKAVRYYKYENKLQELQVEIVRLQAWAIDNNERIVIIFEGRDAAGKGGAIRRITERINRRYYRIVALPKPNEDEATQWYFQRYVNQLPRAGEIVFFDRSWYNRAIVEPVNGFCTHHEYESFMKHVNGFEKMIVDEGIRLVKVYMSISKQEQARRFDEIKSNPLKQWKITPVDERAQELWDVYTEYKDKMFEKTNTEYAPWKIIKANRKTQARIDVINHILKSIPYDKKKEI